MSAGPLVKAKLIPKLPAQGDTLEFMFNPTQLSFDRGISVNENQGSYTEKGLPKTNFQHINACTLTVSNILFDTYEDGTSVLVHINKLKKAVEFAQGTKVPPVYIFTWGDNEYLRCFVRTLSYNLTMFLPNGTPVRADANLTLQEVDTLAPNPNLSAPSSPNREGGGRLNKR